MGYGNIDWKILWNYGCVVIESLGSFIIGIFYWNKRINRCIFFR